MLVCLSVKFKFIELLTQLNREAFCIKSPSMIFFVEKSPIFGYIRLLNAHWLFCICITTYKLEFSDCSEVNRIFPLRKRLTFHQWGWLSWIFYSFTVVSVRLNCTLTFSFYPLKYKDVVGTNMSCLCFLLYRVFRNTHYAFL